MAARASETSYPRWKDAAPCPHSSKWTRRRTAASSCRRQSLTVRHGGGRRKRQGWHEKCHEGLTPHNAKRKAALRRMARRHTELSAGGCPPRRSCGGQGTQAAAAAPHLHSALYDGDDSLHDKLAAAASVRRCGAECFFAICLATRLRTFAEYDATRDWRRYQTAWLVSFQSCNFCWNRSPGSKHFTFFSPSQHFRSPSAMDLVCVCGRPHCLKGVNTAPRVNKTCDVKKSPRARRRVRRRKRAPVEYEAVEDDEGPNPFEAFRNPAVVAAHVG